MEGNYKVMYSAKVNGEWWPGMEFYGYGTRSEVDGFGGDALSWTAQSGNLHGYMRGLPFDGNGTWPFFRDFRPICKTFDMETINVLSQDEKALLRRYLPQMESAVRHGYYTALPSTDMVQLMGIYKRFINKAHLPRPWCSACCLSVLRGLYEMARRAAYGD